MFFRVLALLISLSFVPQARAGPLAGLTGNVSVVKVENAVISLRFSGNVMVYHGVGHSHELEFIGCKFDQPGQSLEVKGVLISLDLNGLNPTYLLWLREADEQQRTIRIELITGRLSCRSPLQLSEVQSVSWQMNTLRETLAELTGKISGVGFKNDTISVKFSGTALIHNQALHAVSQGHKLLDLMGCDTDQVAHSWEVKNVSLNLQIVRLPSFNPQRDLLWIYNLEKLPGLVRIQLKSGHLKCESPYVLSAVESNAWEMKPFRKKDSESDDSGSVH